MSKEIIIGSIGILYDIFKLAFRIFCYLIAIKFIHLGQIDYATLMLVLAISTKAVKE
jgi:hypothetical protein